MGEDYKEKLSLECLWKARYQIDRGTGGFLETRREINVGNINFGNFQHVGIKYL